MHGLSSQSKEQIDKVVGDLFDKAALRLLGPVPKLHHKKITLLGFLEGATLATLFVQAMNNRYLNNIEGDVLKSILGGAFGYIETLKGKTTSAISERIDGLAREARIANQKIEQNQIDAVIKEELDKAKNSLYTIAMSEGTKTRNLGMLMDISRTAALDSERDPTVAFAVIKDVSTCESCIKLNLMPDGITPKLYKLSELSGGYFKRGDSVPSILGQHPHCFTSKRAHVYTEHAGYITIDKVKVGDRVLTHTGKFKAVLATLDSWTKPYYGKLVQVYFEGTSNKYTAGLSRMGQHLSVTPEHQFLTSRGWVEAKNLTENDELMQLFTNCSTCQSDMPVKWGYNKKGKGKLNEHFCSRKCKAEFQWKNPEHRKNVSEKASVQMTEWAKNNPEEMMKRIDKAHKATLALIENGEFWAQKEENKEFLAQHRAKLNALNPRTSKEEEILMGKIKEFYPTLETQKLKYVFTVDGVIEELKVILEYDGGGHYLPIYTRKISEDGFFKKQKGRDKYLNKCGYHVLRYGPDYKIKDVILDIERVSKNSTSRYFFKPLKILKLKYGEACKQKLYDLTVEDDESFVVNGIVSHNCRCTLFYIPSGWGFDASGHLTFVGLDYNALEKQRS